MSGGFNIEFDHDDDLVINDIPSEMMEQIERLAVANGRTSEDQISLILLQIVGADPSQ